MRVMLGVLLASVLLGLFITGYLSEKPSMSGHGEGSDQAQVTSTKSNKTRPQEALIVKPSLYSMEGELCFAVGQRLRGAANGWQLLEQAAFPNSEAFKRPSWVSVDALEEQ